MKNIDKISGFQGDFRFLSNFHPVKIEYEGIQYFTAENAYQAAKTLDTKQKEIIALLTAGQSKRHGKTLDLRPDWEEVKFGIMEEILNLKFQDPALKQMLLDTHHAYLEETNTWGDTIWGVCNGIGQNKLGNILMDIRSKLRRENQ